MNRNEWQVSPEYALVRNGVRGWKLNYNKLPGTPDFYFKKMKIAIFVDGCFWHGCPKCGHIPKTRSSFWKEKINRTIERDRKKSDQLKKMGICSLRFWEHDLKNIEKVIYKIMYSLEKR